MQESETLFWCLSLTIEATEFELRGTFVSNHEASVEWAVYFVHAKLPKLCTGRRPGFGVPPIEVSNYHELAGLVVKNNLHAFKDVRCDGF